MFGPQKEDKRAPRRTHEILRIGRRIDHGLLLAGLEEFHKLALDARIN